jgi:hypothetical protein
MRASVAGLLAACALIGIPRLAGELREYRKERQKPPPVAISAVPESNPAVSTAPAPKVPDAAALPKPAPVPKVLDTATLPMPAPVPKLAEDAALPKPAPIPKTADSAVLPKLAPVPLVSVQRDSSPPPGAGPKPPSQANEAELIPAIQKELARLNYYEGPITNSWRRPVRNAAREFLRKTGSPARNPQPTAGLLAALQAAEPLQKKQAATPPESTRPQEKPIRPSEPSVIVVPLQQNAATPVATVQNEDYLPPWMIGKADQARLTSDAGHAGEAVETRSPELAEPPSSLGDTPKRHFRRRHHVERHWKRRYLSNHGYYSHRRALSFPF